MADTEQSIRQVPEIRFSVDHSSLKERILHRIAPVAFGAGLAYVALNGLDIPNPFSAIGDAVHEVGGVVSDVWHGVGKTVDKGKAGADEAMNDISRRKAEPVIASKIARKAIEGHTSFGQVEREIIIGKASKKYNSWAPQADEWVNMTDGTWVDQASVPGPLMITGSKGDKLTIIIPSAKRNKDTIIRQEPLVDDDPQMVAEVGQLPGDETNTTAAKNELNRLVKKMQNEDDHLLDAASCWAMKTVYETEKRSLEIAGLEVLTTGEIGQDGDPSNDLHFTIEALRPNPLSGESSLTLDDCQSIIKQTATSLDDTLALPVRNMHEVSLPQGKK